MSFVRLRARAGNAQVGRTGPAPRPTRPRPTRPRPRATWLAGPGQESTPWATGLTVATFVAAVVAVADVTLCLALAEAVGPFVIVVNLFIDAGLAPAVWLLQRTPVWRWVGVGVAVGLAVGWVMLPFTAL